MLLDELYLPHVWDALGVDLCFGDVRRRVPDVTWSRGLTLNEGVVFAEVVESLTHAKANPLSVSAYRAFFVSTAEEIGDRYGNWKDPEYRDVKKQLTALGEEAAVAERLTPADPRLERCKQSHLCIHRSCFL